MQTNRLNNIFSHAHAPQEGVGGCVASRSHEATGAAFDQMQELSRVGDLQRGCVVFTAAWLDRIKNYNGGADSRMDHLRRVEVLQNVDNLQRNYRDREISNRGSSFENLFQPTFNHFGLNLTYRGFMDVISDEDTAVGNLARHISESGESHVLVLIRMNGDHHAMATHQESGKLHLFDPNSGEAIINSNNATVKDALRDVIQEYSYNVPVPTIHLLRAT